MSVLAAAAALRQRGVGGGAPTPPPPSGAVDVSALPEAARQVPDWNAYVALGVRAAPAGFAYADPATGVRVRKLTDPTFPAANTSAGHDYSHHGPSCAWVGSDGKRRATVFVDVQGVGLRFVDVLLDEDAAPENPRVAPPRQFDTALVFSRVPSTAQRCYYLQDGVLRAWDTAANAESVGGGFPKDLSSYVGTNAHWLTVSADDGRLCCYGVKGGLNCVVIYEPATNTVWSGDDNTLMDGAYTINEAYISPSGRYVDLPASEASRRRFWDLETGNLSAIRQYEGDVQLSHAAPVWDGVREWALGGNAYRSHEATTAGAIEMVPIESAEQVLGESAPHLQIVLRSGSHTSGEWMSGNAGALGLMSSFDSGVFATIGTWTLYAASVWRVPISETVPSAGIREVVRGAGGIIAQGYVQATSLGAISAGQWWFESGFLYLHSETDPTGTIEATSAGKIHNGGGWYDPLGTVLRLAFHTYGAQKSAYNATAMAASAPDGTSVVFRSDQGVRSGRFDTFLAVMPITGGVDGR